MTTQLCTLTTDVFMGNIHSTLLCHLNLNLETMLCHVGVLLLNSTFTVIVEVSVWQLGKVQSSTFSSYSVVNTNSRMQCIVDKPGHVCSEPSGSRAYCPFHVLL